MFRPFQNNVGKTKFLLEPQEKCIKNPNNGPYILLQQFQYPEVNLCHI